MRLGSGAGRDPEGQPVLLMSIGQTGGQYKANLHTHSTESDGQLSPEQVIDEYRARGYKALAADRPQPQHVALDRLRSRSGSGSDAAH